MPTINDRSYFDRMSDEKREVVYQPLLEPEQLEKIELFNETKYFTLYKESVESDVNYYIKDNVNNIYVGIMRTERINNYQFVLDSSVLQSVRGSKLGLAYNMYKTVIDDCKYLISDKELSKVEVKKDAKGNAVYAGSYNIWKQLMEDPQVDVFCYEHNREARYLLHNNSKHFDDLFKTVVNIDDVTSEDHSKRNIRLAAVIF